MKKKDYVPPKAIVISLQFEGHILAGTNNSLQIGFSSDESLGVTSEQNIFIAESIQNNVILNGKIKLNCNQNLIIQIQVKIAARIGANSNNVFSGKNPLIVV